MKRFGLLFITACMLVSCFACGENKKSDPPVHIIVDPPAPERDYKGADFRISNREEYGGLEVVVDDETSEDIVDMALLLRNAKVEDRYHVEIVRQDNSSATHIKTVLSDLAAQKDTFDLAMTSAGESSPIITSGAVYDWANLPYVRLEESHWLMGVNEKLAVRGSIYTAVSKMCVSTIAQTYALVYNQSLGNLWKGEGFTEGLYDIVGYGEWTYDQFIEIINEFGSSDPYCAFIMPAESIDNWHTAWDIPIFESTAEEGLKDVYMSSKLLTYADRMHTMYGGTKGIRIASQEEAHELFLSGSVLFTTAKLSDALTVLNKMADDYVFIPLPKYDEDQDYYVSPMLDGYSVMSIPKTADAEFAALITEALSKASEQFVYPAYKFDALYVSQAFEVSDMFDIILESVSFDISILFNSELGLMSTVRDDVINNLGDSNLEQTYIDMKDEIADILAEVMSAADEKNES